MPTGFPAWRTVHGWFEKGWFARLMRQLARRRRCGRRAEPRLGIIDTQSVEWIGVRGPRGYDGAKTRVRRQRMALVDAEGHRLAVALAELRDRDTLPALDAGKEEWPSLRLALLDGAFTAERCRGWRNLHGSAAASSSAPAAG